jgi:hypothetical protein
VALAVAVLALLLLGGRWLLSDRGPVRPDPPKVEARFRERVAATGGAVLHFGHAREGAFYRVVVAKRGYQAEAFAAASGPTPRVLDLVTVRLARPEMVRLDWGGMGGQQAVQVRCGGGPVVVEAFRFCEANVLPLTQEEEETCKRLAQDVLVALREALR